MHNLTGNHVYYFADKMFLAPSILIKRANVFIRKDNIIELNLRFQGKLVKADNINSKANTVS